MKAITIELLRFGSESGILRKNDRYLITSGSTIPPREVVMPLDEIDFRRSLKKLRYIGDAKPDEEALAILTNAILEILKLPEIAPPVHFDLVTSASELWALPFEVIHALPDYLSNKYIITRRIRQSFRSASVDWSNVPRILFISATPAWMKADEVPAREHKVALQKALSTWVTPMNIPDFDNAIPDYDALLTSLENASLGDVEAAIQQARDKGKPYTHVHLLAHGIKDDQADEYEYQYGVALESDDQRPTMPDALAAVLKPVEDMPFCVTLAVCDGGNQANPIRPGNLAQSLHVQNIPIVLASQLPLTMDGSVVLTEAFYSSLLKGEDIRDALHEARQKLVHMRDDHHDFMSLVSYVQLPEGYGDYLQEMSIRLQLARLAAIKKWADYVISRKATGRVSLEYVHATMKEKIAIMLDLFEELKARRLIAGNMEELTGHLGSAYKKLAELEFYISGTDGMAHYKEAARASLNTSLGYYHDGFSLNMSAHWNGIQFLCLQIVQTGGLEDDSYWDVVRLAASNACETSDEMWACGTLTELYLLSGFAGKEIMLKEACATIQRMKVLAGDDPFPMESMGAQLYKYVNWWTRDNGYFPKMHTDVADQAKELMQIISE